MVILGVLFHYRGLFSLILKGLAQFMLKKLSSSTCKTCDVISNLKEKRKGKKNYYAIYSTNINLGENIFKIDTVFPTDLVKNRNLNLNQMYVTKTTKLSIARLKSDRTRHYCSSLINDLARLETQRFALKTV